VLELLIFNVEDPKELRPLCSKEQYLGKVDYYGWGGCGIRGLTGCRLLFDLHVMFHCSAHLSPEFVKIMFKIRVPTPQERRLRHKAQSVNAVQKIMEIFCEDHAKLIR
jgi:hypothetical protein